VQGGQLVLEEYFHGYTRDDLHRLASATKSISSICVGIGLDMGFMQSVNQPLNSIFPQAGEDLTLKHVLTMSLGLDWSEEECNMIHGTGEEFFSYILSRSSSIPPGSVFRYTNPDVNLLSGVIHSSSGLFPDEFAERYLFEPLGITDYDWEYSSEDGHRLMDGSLELRPRDMAKIGQLVLQSGVWDGVQVVSDTWLAESTDEHFIVDDDFSYGYLWWLAEIQGEEQQSRVIIAIGIGSQFIAVIPDADTVIVVTGGNEDNGKELIILNLLVELIENSQLH
ncbi:MAG: serine hydrolase, partial [Bacteroidales bacterium]|nr:serine hydrolase [Bacteroidales bacterium]